jgi:hypothetical protein
MKNILLVLILLPVLLIACKESPKSKDGFVFDAPVKYNDYIINRQSKIVKDVIKWANMADTDLDSASAFLGKMAVSISAEIEAVKGMPAYGDNTEFRDAAINSFEFYKRTCRDVYSKLLDYRRLGEKMTDADKEAMQVLVENISKEEKQMDLAFKKAQKNFADQFNIKLGKNELQNTIDSLNK